jgi:hypothetical protein
LDVESVAGHLLKQGSVFAFGDDARMLVGFNGGFSRSTQDWGAILTSRFDRGGMDGQDSEAS